MLKPKRKISKQEIKKDPFLEFINDGQRWLQDNKKIIYQVVFGVVAVIAVVYFLNNNRNISGTAGEALLGKALLSQDIGDVENAKFQLQTLVDDYNGTKAGVAGKYYLGKMFYDDGEIFLVLFAFLEAFIEDVEEFGFGEYVVEKFEFVLASGDGYGGGAG